MRVFQKVHNFYYFLQMSGGGNQRPYLVQKLEILKNIHFSQPLQFIYESDLALFVAYCLWISQSQGDQGHGASLSLSHPSFLCMPFLFQFFISLLPILYHTYLAKRGNLPSTDAQVKETSQ